MAWHSALAITALGLSVLGYDKLAPPASGGPVAVLVAPWQTGGMAFAAAANLPIIDIAWGGRLVIFDSTGNPSAIDGLGLIAVSAAGPFGCLADNREG